jgi:hypothetical protein
MFVAKPAIVGLLRIGPGTPLGLLNSKPLAVNLHLPKLPSRASVVWILPHGFTQQCELPCCVAADFRLSRVGQQAIRRRFASIDFIT